MIFNFTERIMPFFKSERRTRTTPFRNWRASGTGEPRGRRNKPLRNTLRTPALSIRQYWRPQFFQINLAAFPAALLILSGSAWGASGVSGEVGARYWQADPAGDVTHEFGNAGNDVDDDLGLDSEGQLDLFGRLSFPSGVLDFNYTKLHFSGNSLTRRKRVCTIAGGDGISRTSLADNSGYYSILESRKNPSQFQTAYLLGGLWTLFWNFCDTYPQSERFRPAFTC